MKGLRIVPLLLAGLPIFCSAQTIRSGYVDWGLRGTGFPAALEKWEKGQKWTDDDNFFISRIKPKERFRNQATQVNNLLDETNDKNLLFWVPINRSDFNALPDGVFDSEVFPMWQYVTHYGNWSASLARIPGGFADVAHKNGVPVTPLAAMPWGPLPEAWEVALGTLVNVGARKLADYLLAYGIDGIGYNSEFSCNAKLVRSISNLHADLYKILHTDGENPFADVIWYDGTNNRGTIQFDCGLGSHNTSNFGDSENRKSILFFNYNWNDESLMEKTVKSAQELGRSPLDVYCSVNLQGREPQIGTPVWTLLSQYPLSIGIWGAHTQNMFFESRGEGGSTPEQCQRTYLDRVENWFTGSSRNPVNTPELGNSLIYSSQNEEFQGMSKMMTARSSLKWNLSDEPFITYFNLGNGRFFNYNGERQHDSEWYNISMQDYLPTWRWWFAKKLLGREASDVPADGLKAEFVWDEAWMGGSTIRIHGNTSSEYLHLFKTEFELKEGDEITFRYKPLKGSADVYLALSMKGSEETPVDMQALNVMKPFGRAYDMWVEKKFIVGKDINIPSGSELALVALKFDNARSLDMRLGEFSIVRKEDMKRDVAKPEIEKGELLSARHDGYDGKLIFNMPNDKAPGEICYNTDVNTSLFKLYAQQEGKEPVLMGMTTSWAGLVYSAPFDSEGEDKVRFGVSALALDHRSESEIAWGEYQEIAGKYEVSDAIVKSADELRPGESFTVGYADPLHENADWKILDASSKVILESKDSDKIDVKDGLTAPGLYTLAVNGYENSDGERVKAQRELKGFIQVIGEEQGTVPRILEVNTLNAISSGTSAEGIPVYGYEYSDAEFAFTADLGEANVSQGVAVGKDAFGFRFKDTDLNPTESFSVSFWMKPESFGNNAVHMLNIRYKGDPWTINNWGWFWHTLTGEGTNNAFTIRMDGGKNASYTLPDFRIYPGAWVHMAYVFEYDGKGNVRPSLYVNGEKQTFTSYSLGDETFEGEVPFVGPVREWNEENVLALGGYVHTLGSVNCNLDNFMVWKKALSEEDVKVAMGDLNERQLPDELVGYFDFESPADNDLLFTNKGKSNFKAGMHDYVDLDAEGQGVLRWKAPEFVAGSPYVKGEGFKIASEAVWSVPGGKVARQALTADGGTAQLEYYDWETNDLHPEGYPVRLTLQNSYGSDTRDFILRFNHTGVETVKDVKNLKVYPAIFDRELNIETPIDGTITVTLHSIDGRKMHSEQFSATALETMRIYPSISAGVYILTVEKDGEVLGATRVVKR